MTRDGHSWTGDHSRRTQLPEEVAAYVRDLIIFGAVRSGDFLRMEPIADAIGVSITPVREGLLALSSEGFVRLSPRRGFVVAPFTEQDVRDLFWAQARLGAELAARAAVRIGPEQLSRLDENLHLHDLAIDSGDDGAITEVGYVFHREVNIAAASHRLALLQGAVVRHLPRRFYAAIEGPVTADRHEHPALVAALRAGDADAARTIMSAHILDGAERLIDTLRGQGLWELSAHMGD